MKTIYLLVGTHKGAFLFTSDVDRKRWELKGPFLKGGDVNHVVLDARSEPTIFACVNSYWWGSGVKMSKDFGVTWIDSETGIRFEENSGMKVERVWAVTPGLKSEPDTLYAGVDPGTMFKSEDGGRSWQEVSALTNHATRTNWMPGAGGLMVHSICPHPTDTKKMYIGISAAGVFSTENGGTTWEPRNNGVLAEFLPDKYPTVGQCVHHLELHPSNAELLYQQNHCGVYRSENGGKDWIDISEGLPSRFGFPIQIHSHDPNTIYVIPEEGAEFRAPVNGEFGVFRSRNRGATWEKLITGLPSHDAYMHVHRQAMAVDSCESCGIYFGTTTGELFFSRDSGDSWEVLARHLAPIFSVSCAVI